MKKLLLSTIIISTLFTLYLGSNFVLNQQKAQSNKELLKQANNIAQVLPASNIEITAQNSQNLIDYSKTTTIIFDLGETLLEQDHMKMASEIGLLDMMFYKDTDKLKDKLFAVLYRLGEQPKIEGQLQAKSGDNIVPGIVCQWFTGKISGKEVLEKVDAELEKLEKTDFFADKTEKRIIKRALELMFDPEKLAKITKPIKQSLKLIKKLSEATDKDGKPLYELFILSNWDKESFDIFYNSKNGQKLFKYFKPENIIISGKVGHIKPHTKIFEHVLDQLHERKLIDKGNLNHEIKFIDDQPENIEAAKNLKISGILFDKSKHEALVSELNNQGITI